MRRCRGGAAAFGGGCMWGTHSDMEEHGGQTWGTWGRMGDRLGGLGGRLPAGPRTMQARRADPPGPCSCLSLAGNRRGWRESSGAHTRRYHRSAPAVAPPRPPSLHPARRRSIPPAHFASHHQPHQSPHPPAYIPFFQHNCRAASSLSSLQTPIRVWFFRRWARHDCHVQTVAD